MKKRKQEIAKSYYDKRMGEFEVKKDKNYSKNI